MSGNQTLPGILKRGLSRHTVPSGKSLGLGGRGSTSMKTAVFARQISSASAVVSTLAPASVPGTAGDEDVGLVRIDFAEDDEDASLDEISWDEFFEKFEEKQLAFLYQDQKANGEPSTFNKLVSR